MKIKILHVSPSYKPAFIYGGPTISVSNLCENIAKQETEVHVLTTSANGPQELPVQHVVQPNLEISYFPRLTGDHTHFSPVLLWHVWGLCKKYDIVHIHSWWNLVAILSLLICRMRGVKPIISPRGMLSVYSVKGRLRQVFHNTFGRWLLKGSTAHFTSEKEKDEGLNYIPQWSFFILPNIIQLPDYPVTSSHVNSNYKILYIGRIHPVKRLELLFHAVKELECDFQLSIVGSGNQPYEDELKNLSIQLNLHDKIEWLGWQEGISKYQSIVDADVLTLSSITENFANVVIEALSLGTPVVITEGVGVAEYIKKHSFFGLVSEDSSKKLALSLQTIYDSRDYFRSTRRNRIEKLKVDFDVDNVTKQYLQAYNAHLTKIAVQD